MYDLIDIIDIKFNGMNYLLQKCITNNPLINNNNKYNHNKIHYNLKKESIINQIPNVISTTTSKTTLTMTTITNITMITKIATTTRQLTVQSTLQ